MFHERGENTGLWIRTLGIHWNFFFIKMCSFEANNTLFLSFF